MQLRVQRRRLQPKRFIGLRDIGAVAGPSPISRRSRQAGRHGVAIDKVAKRHQISVGIDQDGLEAALERGKRACRLRGMRTKNLPL